VSFNIKQIYQTYYSTKNEEFLQILLETNADIICLEETNYELTKYLTKCLLEKTGKSYTYIYIENNAIITYYCIMNVEKKLIKIKQTYIDRSYIKLELDDPKLKTNYKITVLHLDHLSEGTRILQLDEMNQMLETSDIIVGDFNSIKKEDYSNSFIKTINQMRKNGRKEEVDFRVIKRIENYGFTTNKFKMETCPYGTRVDYVFMKPTITDKFGTVDGVINYIKDNITDHNMIWTIIYPRDTTSTIEINVD